MLAEEMKSLCEDLGLQKVHIRGDNVMFCCPYHGEKNPSCGISVTKEVGGCFACGQSFNLVSLTAFTQNISYSKALEYLEEHSSSDYKTVRANSRYKMYGEENGSEKVVPKVKLALYKSGKIAHPYLLNRGFTENDFVDFKLGWDEELKRITIPFFDFEGNLLGFSGRAVLEKSADSYFSVYGNTPKYYIYDHFNAKDYFFPMNLFKGDKEVILVEGLLDALWLHKHGYHNTLSIISAEVSKAQIAKLKAMGIERIILALDNDDAGKKGCDKLYNSLKTQFTFKKVNLPYGKKDIQECSKDEIDLMFENVENFPRRDFKKYLD